MSLTEKLAGHFALRPGVWVNGYDLMRIGGSFAFRTRISELRRAPWSMAIENRVERHPGRTETFYRYVPKEVPRAQALFDLSAAQ